MALFSIVHLGGLHVSKFIEIFNFTMSKMIKTGHQYYLIGFKNYEVMKIENFGIVLWPSHIFKIQKLCGGYSVNNV